jgi:hypothetical protein
MRLEGLERVLQRTMRRMRAQRALRAAAYAGSAAMLGLLLTALTLRFSQLARPLGWQLASLAILPLIVPLVRALLPIERADAARRIDRAHGLHDTVQAALEVATLPEAGRSSFAAALLREAEALSSRLSARRALPLHVPRIGLLAVPLFAAALLVWQLPPAARTRQALALKKALPAAHPHTAREDGPGADELELAEQAGAHPDQREIMRAFRAGEISRAQAIVALLALERRLRTAESEQLLRGELLERLAALLPGAAARGPRTRTLESTASELRSQASSPEQREEQRRFLEEKRRELEKLRSEHAKSAAERRELEQLARHLDDAAKAVRENQPEQAAAQLDAARGRMRRQTGGQQDRERPTTADKAAQQNAERQAGAADKAAQQNGERQAGAADKAAQQRELLQRRRRDAPGDAPGRASGLLSRENERRFAERAEQGSQEAQPAPGSGGTGNPAASSPEPSLLGREPRPKVRLEDHAAGSAQSDGPARSEVVLSAADRGFATEGYRKVYGDYRRHAEALLEQDQVPNGYRYYVRRYFQLIRPRGGAP